MKLHGVVLVVGVFALGSLGLTGCKSNEPPPAPECPSVATPAEVAAAPAPTPAPTAEPQAQDDQPAQPQKKKRGKKGRGRRAGR